MDAWIALFGRNPAGPEVALLCALAALALGLGIGLGCALLRRADRAGRAPTSLAARELGLVALWRLERAARSAGCPSAGQAATRRRPPARCRPGRVAPLVGERA